MRPARAVALAQVCTGRFMLHRPERLLSLLGYPQPTAGPRAVMRLLGARHLVQGAAELSGRRSFLLAGAAVDVVHAGTALLYARHSTIGKDAGHRNASLALALAAAQLAAAAVTPEAPRRQQPGSSPAGTRPTRPPTRSGGRHPTSARVSSPRSPAWPEPTDASQQIRVDYPGEYLVQLRGGAMDGATVALEPHQSSYSINDAERGRVRYMPSRELDGDLPVLRLAEDTAPEGEDSAC